MIVDFPIHRAITTITIYLLHLVLLVNHLNVINLKVSGNTPSVTKVTNKITLSNELRMLIEDRLELTLKGVEDTLQKIVEKQKITPETLKEELKSLEHSFHLLFQMWNLEILYTQFLKGSMGFGELKKVLGVNSRTLSDKLKTLTKHGYIIRNVENGPPVKVKYFLTEKGKNTILLAIPLLYYSSSIQIN